MFQIKVVEKINTHFIFSELFPENRTFNKIMSKNMVEPERTQTIWRLRVEYWLSKPSRTRAHTHTIYDTEFRGNSDFMNVHQCYGMRNRDEGRFLRVADCSD
jgi:hypothetical protein